MFKSKYGRVRKRKKPAAAWCYRQEIIGVLISALLVFLALSFFSHNATDNSWFYFSSKNKIASNLCGALGAHVSALFFFLFGSASFVLLLSLFVIVLLLFKAIPDDESMFGRLDISQMWFRLSMFPLLTLSSSALFHMYGVDFVASNPGGVVGQLLTRFFSLILGRTGSYLFFYSVIWVGFLVLAQVSFVQFLALVGRVLLVVGSFVVRLSWSGFRYSGRIGYELSKKLLSGAMFLGSRCFAKLGSKFKKPEVSIIFAGKKKQKVEEDNHLFEELKDFVGKVNRDIVVPSAVETKNYEESTIRNVFALEHFINRDITLLPNTVLASTVFTQDVFNKVRRELGKLKVSEKVNESRSADGLSSSVGEFNPSIHYDLPDFSQFSEQVVERSDIEGFEQMCRDRGKKLEEKLTHFGVKGKVVAIRPGPVITLFEYKPDIDSKISKIMALEDDLAMALTALSIRIIAPIPGRNVVGFEISNQQREDVHLSTILNNERFESMGEERLPLAIGVDITGNPVVYDLVKMPHLLVAGSTGSGKSVGLNAMLVSLLCKLRPDQLKIILIDPKRLEFAPYADIPHLLFPIVTAPRKAIPVLKWVVQEMEERYDVMAQSGARNIIDYHRIHAERSNELSAMPFIVLIIDELADLMMVAGKDVETSIARTAQMARAAGIHMIVATQRPSVDVLTGMIKVNFPARVAFRVSSKIDSRTIIDAQGAEKLLGRGDMLFLDSGSSNPKRIHGAYVSTKQITKLADYLRSQQQAEYLNIQEELKKVADTNNNDFEDELYNEIIDFVKTVDEVSISLLQRRYRIGFNRSARLIEQLESDGIVAPQQGGKMRKVIR